MIFFSISNGKRHHQRPPMEDNRGTAISGLGKRSAWIEFDDVRIFRAQAWH